MAGKLGRVNGHSADPAGLTYSSLSQQARYENNTAVIAFYYKKLEVSHMKQIF